MVKAKVKQLLGRFGLGIYRLDGKYDEDGLVTVHSSSFRDDGAFQKAYARGVQASGGMDPRFRWRVHTGCGRRRTACGWRVTL